MLELCLSLVEGSISVACVTNLINKREVTRITSHELSSTFDEIRVSQPFVTVDSMLKKVLKIGGEMQKGVVFCYTKALLRSNRQAIMR